MLRGLIGLLVLALIPAAAEEFRVLPGQRILLNGDSISKGYATGNYTDPSPLRTIYGISRILMKENLSHPPSFSSLPGVWEGLHPDGTPKTVSSLAAEIRTYVARGEMRPGDWMVYEDAGELDKLVEPGPWPNAKNMYRRYRKSMRDMIAEAENSIGRDHVVAMTMFDYNPKYPWCAWDAPLDDGVHTGNDAIRDEAAALGVRVIDMNQIMDRAQEYVSAAGWGRIVGPDGIHPNVYGNYVMAVAILQAMGADVARWKTEGVAKHFRHPETGGDLKSIWGFVKDPSDAERLKILTDLHGIATRSFRVLDSGVKAPASAHTFRRMIRYGRVLAHPAKQPEFTTRPASYELGKLYQLDRDTVLLAASLREQGGHDFEIGNDGVIFRKLSDITPDRAFPINRLEPDGQGGVLSKYPLMGGFMPLGVDQPGAGTGFALSSTVPFLADRSEIRTSGKNVIEFLQMRWDGKSLKVVRDQLPAPYDKSIRVSGFNCIPDGSGFLCPQVLAEGIVVIRFGFKDGRWMPVAQGRPFLANKTPENFGFITGKTGKDGKTEVKGWAGEAEPSIQRVEHQYYVTTRGSDPYVRLYLSPDGLNYHLVATQRNHTVPLALNQGLDGSLYLATNPVTGWLRNPLLLFAQRGLSFVDPVLAHDEKQIHEDRHKDPSAEVPFVDHPIAENVFLGGRWRHLLVYRVLDLRETNGEGAPPTPQTGIYITELEYDSTTAAPWSFR